MPTLAQYFRHDRDGLFCVGKMLRTVDDEERRAIDMDVTLVAQKRLDAFDEIEIVVGTIFLSDQNIMLGRVPSPRPVFIGPAQAKRHVALGIGEHVIERRVQESTAREPVIMITKTVDAVSLGQFNLLTARLAQTKVVESKIGWQMGLRMAGEKRRGLGDVGPFGKSPSPPFVVFRNGMKLRQVKRDQPDLTIVRPRRPFGFGIGQGQRISCALDRNPLGDNLINGTEMVAREGLALGGGQRVPNDWQTRSCRG